MTRHDDAVCCGLGRPQRDVTDGARQTTEQGENLAYQAAKRFGIRTRRKLVSDNEKICLATDAGAVCGTKLSPGTRRIQKLGLTASALSQSGLPWPAFQIPKRPPKTQIGLSGGCFQPLLQSSKSVSVACLDL